VIDVARLVAADTGVDHRALVDDKEKGVVVFIRPFLVAPIGLFVRNALADILDDARSGRDTAQRKDNRVRGIAESRTSTSGTDLPEASLHAIKVV